MEKSKLLPKKNIFSLKINNVVDYLEKQNINLKTLNSLEVFGGSGETDRIIADKVKSFEIWEINNDFFDTLTRTLPNSKIHICNSIEKLHTNTFEQKFDLILIDNPMSVFGNKNNPQIYCEHFDILKNINKITNNETIVIFLVNKKPFYSKKFKQKNSEWKKRRKQFYGDIDIDNISIDFLLTFYKEYFQKIGFRTVFSKNILRHHPHLDYLIFKLKKNDLKNIVTFDMISLSNLIHNN
jgi:hypothetical protein